jgi:hypothetical protein
LIEKCKGKEIENRNRGRRKGMREWKVKEMVRVGYGGL